jgi:hypothetical protein
MVKRMRPLSAARLTWLQSQQPRLCRQLLVVAACSALRVAAPGACMLLLLACSVRRPGGAVLVVLVVLVLVLLLSWLLLVVILLLRLRAADRCAHAAAGGKDAALHALAAFEKGPLLAQGRITGARGAGRAWRVAHASARARGQGTMVKLTEEAAQRRPRSVRLPP